MNNVRSEQIHASSADQGRKLFLKFMDEFFEKGNADACSVERRWRKDQPQVNLVRPYIEELCKRPELIETFSAMLTDYLTLLEGPIVERGYYQGLVKRMNREEIHG